MGSHGFNYQQWPTHPPSAPFLLLLLNFVFAQWSIRSSIMSKTDHLLTKPVIKKFYYKCHHNFSSQLVTYHIQYVPLFYLHITLNLTSVSMKSIIFIPSQHLSLITKALSCNLYLQLVLSFHFHSSYTVLSN